MLVLTRRLDQSIIIGDPADPESAVEIIVTEVRGDQVRLGIQAPRSVPVHRAEIYQQIQEGNREAAGAAVGDVPAGPKRL